MMNSCNIWHIWAFSVLLCLSTSLRAEDDKNKKAKDKDKDDPYLFLEEHKEGPKTQKSTKTPATTSDESKKQTTPATEQSVVEKAELIDLYADSREGAVGFKHETRVTNRSQLGGDTNQLVPQDPVPIPDRWRIGMPASTLRVKGSLENPYRQNMLKGDYPIAGQNTFLIVNGISDSVFEVRDTPTPSGVTTERAGSFDFFGKGRQFNIQQNFIAELDLFHGETDFKPRDWDIRITPVFNVNFLDVEERNAVNIDPRQETTRLDSHIAFQELFAEKHIVDLSPNFDFISARAGIQFFNLDNRGFLFADNNLGARAFGNYASNRWQYNLAYFEMLSKDTNSGLNNKFDRKHEHVVLANLIRQDTFTRGYDISVNLAFSDQDAHEEFNSNGLIVRPTPIGTISPNQIRAGYVGFGGTGHIGRFNITHQFYQAVGSDSNNQLAGRSTTINAQMAALELSYDVDWMRFRGSVFYASGDGNPTDHTARGFETIFDDPNFAGGEFSYWVRQGLAAGNSATLLKSRFSLIPDLSSGKEEGSGNFVNPGVELFTLGYEAQISPKLRAVLNENYIRLDKTEPIEFLLGQNNIHHSIGFDSSLGLIYRPMLNNQIVLTGGAALLTPGQGFQDIYEKRRNLYSCFLGLTLRY